MRRILLTIFVIFTFLSSAQAQSKIRINATKIRAVLKDNATNIVLPISNFTDQSVKAQVTLSWVTPEDTELNKISRALIISPGFAEVLIPLPITEPSIWTRLRYSLSPDRADARSFEPISGILSLAHIADHAFEIKVSQAGRFTEGYGRVSIFAEAVHPVSRAAVSNVVWEASISLENGRLKPVQINHPAEGFAEFIFDVPNLSDKPREGGSVNVAAQLGDFRQKASISIEIFNHAIARFQTDKPIYQPGQTIHMRAVILNAAGRAAAGEKAKISIQDENREELHSIQLESSPYGIIQDDWTIPASAMPGTYTITLSAQGDESWPVLYHSVRVNRYELPTFSVSAKPDHTSYLPGEQPKITITGSYLFGKPVPNGKVKIVRMEERKWNSNKRKMESLEKTVAEGEADESGAFSTQVYLKTDHEDFAQSESKQFNDLHFAAYYTDRASGRTEQRRFDIRITRQPIHIYGIRTRGGGPLPAAFYVTTAYPDGLPVSASVEIMFRGQTLKIQTNNYGIGKAFLPGSNEIGSSDYESIKIKATDNWGKTGVTAHGFRDSGEEMFRLETSHTIHRAGEPVILKITTPKEAPADQVVMIHAISDADKRIASKIVHIKDHAAEVEFPYQSEFRRTVVFGAWNALDPKTNNGLGILASKAVIFPDGSDLKVTATAERASYKPGETATFRVQTASSNGRPVQAALGMAIVDQAVLERARTDADFGHRSWFACAFCYNKGEEEIGGIRLNDLYALKANAPISRELDLIAEAFAAKAFPYIDSRHSENMSDAPMFSTILSQMKSLTAAINSRYLIFLEFPKDSSELVSMLGKDWLDLRDPWGSSYYAGFKINQQYLVISIWSNGPDKQPKTKDDFIVRTINQEYFKVYGHLIRDALHKQDYPGTDAELLEILKNNGLLLDALRDPWGNSYRIKIDTIGSRRQISIQSAGPDRVFDSKDDFSVAIFSGSYFTKERKKIEETVRNAQVPPHTIEDFLVVLANAGIDLSLTKDAWGRPYRVTSAVRSTYDDRIRLKTVQVYNGPAELQKEVTPVTRTHIVFSIHSDGPDLNAIWDDFSIADFSILLKEEIGQIEINKDISSSKASSGTGRITGTVKDQTGSVIPGATIALIQNAVVLHKTNTDKDGNFFILSIPSGTYLLCISAHGFMNHNVTGIPISGGEAVSLDLNLRVSDEAVAAQLEITTSAENLMLEASSSTGTVLEGHTPRVREYFPETLLWIPELITNANGTATTQVKLADSVTTWKVAVIASTQDGRIAETESDFRTFQPFFIDFNPPSVLTEGDQVSLPVTIRNYLEKPQKTNVRFVPNDWAAAQSNTVQQATIPANGSVNVHFDVQAKTIKEKASQRILAEAGREEDAIEKSFKIHPDGQKTTRTYGDLVAGPAAFAISIPQNAIKAGTRGELRIYPNIASLLFESASAILQAPHGCAEQTISAGYANLITLRFARASGIQSEKLEKNAFENIRLAINQLKAFTDDGGVSYWGTGHPDTAVTAYALNFLMDASTVTPVNPEDLSSMVSWLEEHQSSDGRWMPRNIGAPSEDRQALLLTGTVARALAAAAKNKLEVKSGALGGAYHHMAALTDSLDEPYMLANFILAAIDSGDEALVKNAAARLTALAREERGGVYWDLQTNTPFYGWGTAGRYETTGLVISALSAWRAQHPESKDLDALIRRGLVFLLRGRNHSGYWHSTQSTLQAMRALADAAKVLGTFGNQGGTLEIRINDRAVKTITIPADFQTIDPIFVDMSAFLSSGDNRISLNPSQKVQATMILFSSIHWLPWDQTQTRTSPELRLDVQFDKPETRVGGQIQCSVKAERIGFRGYGMMIAEIGLPPGVEVDRSSLEALLEDEVKQYEVLPDRVVFYLWPQAGGASFQFGMSARFPMKAKSGSSILYDYYNPEALSEVPPSLWTVK